MVKAKLNKKRKEIIEKEITKTPKKFPKISAISHSILFIIFLLSFYIRGITPIENTFRDGIVGFAIDDSVYHMRLVENTIQYFPHRIFYDPYTLYPYGSQLSWGPLFDQLIGFFAIISGFIIDGGMPAQSTIDTVGAFFPAIIGALMVFPIYFIGKELIDEKAGLIGAFLIAILPGQFISRSVLGFTDHHIAEVFFTTLMMMFFIIAIKKAENITFDHWLNKDWATLKTPLTYSIFAGIAFGAYLLTWTTGVFFAVVFAIFVVIQYIIDHFKGKSTEYLGVVGIVAYLIAMIMVLPYFDSSNRFNAFYYSYLHLVVTGGAAIVFALLSLISREMHKKEYSGFHYLAFVIGLIVVSFGLMSILSPSLYGASIGGWSYLFGGLTGGRETIAEATGISYDVAIQSFGYNYIFSYIGIILLLYYSIRRTNAEFTLVAIWSAFVLTIMLSQNRFAYYYAVNVAILSGFLGAKLMNFGDWNKFNSDDIIECIKKLRIQHLISLIIVIYVIGFLPTGASPYEITTQSAQYGALQGGFYEWHEALTWMRYNTPEPELPYYSQNYEKPQSGETYKYSEKDYGVMSWWDYGHIITYWGHRIPNANPFQAGIGGGTDHLPGASTYLTAQSEEEANEILDKLSVNGKPGARYVVSNSYMAYSIQPVFGVWDLQENFYGNAIGVRYGNAQYFVPGKKFYNTMESRLHIFDGNGLKHYRLVHESNINPRTRGGNLEVGGYIENNQLIPLCEGALCVGKYWYNRVYNENIPVEYSGYAKIFEYVKGAKISGNAPPNTNVTISTNIRTNIGRAFPYSQTTMSDLNGKYEIVVPYSTTGTISGETNFDTMPSGKYSLTYGNTSKEIDVDEKDVLEGKTIQLELI